MSLPVLHPDGKLNANILASRYAVRGRIYQEATARKKAGKRVIFTNVGNPQALKQPPITFPRQVLALTNYPELIDHPAAKTIFPQDALDRARRYLEAVGSTGAYQDSRGNVVVRQEVADFIHQRDGYPVDIDTIFTADGASPAIQNCLKLIIRDKNDGILLPTPQYPLYSAAVVALGGTIVPYALNEDKNWALDIDLLKNSVSQARSQGLTIRALVIINPGNPTGAMLSEDNMRDLIAWCASEEVILLADEVYQVNIYGSKPFISFRKVALEMGQAAAKLELFSFHTVSKGVFGECGRRGGYLQAHNIHPDALAEVYKLFSINLSSNVDGQLMLGMMCNPPKAGDASHARYEEECRNIFESLKRRAKLVSSTFNTLPGVQCRDVEGALYAFPQIFLPEKAVQAAQAKGIEADLMYCLELLDRTGICAVPGSGFGQAEGTFHFRTTILPPEEEMQEVMHLFSEFHRDFMQRYAFQAKM